MTESTVEFYRPEGRFPAAGFTVAIVGGALVAYPLGVAYGCLMPVMPLIYLGFLIALAFSAVLGHAVFAALKLGRVRHRGVATVAAVTSGLAALGGAWMGDRFVRLSMIFHSQGVEESVKFFVPPAVFSNYVSYFFHEGFWGLMGGVPMFGLPLAVIWLGEAALILGLCVRTVRRKLRESPYCEACGRWTVRSRGIRFLVPKTARTLIDELKKGNPRALLQAMPSSEGVPLALRVDLAQCGGCADSTYMTMLYVSGGSKFRQFVWPEEKPEVEHLKIGLQDADELRKPPKLADMAALPAPGRTRPKK